MHNRLRKWLATLAVPALGLGLGLAVSTATPAHAQDTQIVSAQTVISNDPDSGGNGNWASDNFTRTLTIFTDSTSSDCAVSSLPGFDASIDTCYVATISDSGSGATFPDSFQPNQGTGVQTGNKVDSPTESVPFTGSSGYLLYAPNGTLPQTGNVVVPQSLDYTTLGACADTATAVKCELTGTWPLVAFAGHTYTTGGGYALAGSAISEDNNWTWTYGNACESWTDSFANNDGQSTPISTDGNITGEACSTSPVVSIADPGSQNTQVDTGVALQIDATDSLSRTLTYSASGLPVGLSINSATGLISGTPTTLGVSSVTVTVTDGTDSNSVSFAWTVSSTSPPPSTTIAGPGPISSFSDYSRSCLDVRNADWASGGQLQLWTCGADAGRDQQAILVSFNGHEVLGFLVPSGLPQGPWCVTDNGVGQRLTITGCTGNANQQISKQGPYYKFADGTVMDDAGYATYNGAPVIDYAQNFGRNQRFSLP